MSRSTTTKKAKDLGLEDLRYDMQVTSVFGQASMIGQAIRFYRNPSRSEVVITFSGYGTEGEATMTTGYDDDVTIDRVTKTSVHFGGAS